MWPVSSGHRSAKATAEQTSAAASRGARGSNGLVVPSLARGAARRDVRGLVLVAVIQIVDLLETQFAFGRAKGRFVGATSASVTSKMRIQAVTRQPCGSAYVGVGWWCQMNRVESGIREMKTRSEAWNLSRHVLLNAESQAARAELLEVIVVLLIAAEILLGFVR